MTNEQLAELWANIQKRLDQSKPEWRDLIIHYKQVTAIESRARGKGWSDVEVFESLVRSVLSNSTDWAKIEKVLPGLSACFHGFDPHWYSALEPPEVEERFQWFKRQSAASMTLRRDLRQLVNAAKKLCALSQSEGSLESYFASLYHQSGRDPKRMAMALGSTKGTNKLPTLGIPLAAEFLKNLGYDVSKPDRHIVRAVGSFGWVAFAKWPSREGRKHPAASEGELLAAMSAMERFGRGVGVLTAYVDNAVWLICAKSGIKLSNAQLAALAAPYARAASPA